MVVTQLLGYTLWVHMSPRHCFECTRQQQGSKPLGHHGCKRIRISSKETKAKKLQRVCAHRKQNLLYKTQYRLSFSGGARKRRQTDVRHLYPPSFKGSKKHSSYKKNTPKTEEGGGKKKKNHINQASKPHEEETENNDTFCRWRSWPWRQPGRRVVHRRRLLRHLSPGM